MIASAARHVGLPPTPLSLRFSWCPPSYSVRITPAGPYAPIGGFSGTATYGLHLHYDAPKISRCAGAAQPAVHYDFGLGRVPRTSPCRVDPPPRVRRPRLPLTAAPTTSRTPTPVPIVPIPPDRDRAESLGAPLLGLSTLSEPPSAPTADLDALGAAAELHFGDSAARYSHAGWEREQLLESLRAMPPANTFFSAGQWPCPPKS